MLKTNVLPLVFSCEEKLYPYNDDFTVVSFIFLYVFLQYAVITEIEENMKNSSQKKLDHIFSLHFICMLDFNTNKDFLHLYNLSPVMPFEKTLHIKYT